jgi:two-component system, LytTR family, response regulator
MKKPLKALIVDDERLARKGLIGLLEAHEEIQVVGEARDVKSAQQAIEKLQPDVVFLDIQMPGPDGFELLDKLSTSPKIVFVTAFDKFAIRAFEVNALDYLMKPVSAQRLEQTIQRLMQNQPMSVDYLRKLDYTDRLFLQFDSRIRFVKVSSIICIEAEGDYSAVTTGEGKLGLVLKSMKEWEYRLPEQHFLRIHRSVIVNIDSIERIEKWFNNSFRIHMKGASEPLEMSRRSVAKLRERFG